MLSKAVSFKKERKNGNNSYFIGENAYLCLYMKPRLFINGCLGALICFISPLLSSCGDDETFRVEGSIAGSPTMNLRVAYYGNGGMQMAITAAREGKFEFTGSSQQPTLVEIMDNDYRPIGRLYAVNGDELSCRLNRANPFDITVSGSDIARRYADAMRDKAETMQRGSWSQRNDIIAGYIAANPTDIVSTLLLLTAYDSAHDPFGADSLMTAISPEARPATLTDSYNFLLHRLVSEREGNRVMPIRYVTHADSMTTFNPSQQAYALLALSDKDCGRTDSIVPALRRLSRNLQKGHFTIVDFSLDPDTIIWHRTIKPDSASWRQGWCAAAIASPGIERLAAPSLPYFVVVDSAGSRVFGSPSVLETEKFLSDNVLKK